MLKHNLLSKTPKLRVRGGLRNLPRIGELFYSGSPRVIVELAPAAPHMSRGKTRGPIERGVSRVVPCSVHRDGHQWGSFRTVVGRSDIRSGTWQTV
jgi:hypothetical protein